MNVLSVFTISFVLLTLADYQLAETTMTLEDTPKLETRNITELISENVSVLNKSKKNIFSKVLKSGDTENLIKKSVEREKRNSGQSYLESNIYNYLERKKRCKRKSGSSKAKKVKVKKSIKRKKGIFESFIEKSADFLRKKKETFQNWFPHFRSQTKLREKLQKELDERKVEPFKKDKPFVRPNSSVTPTYDNFLHKSVSRNDTVIGTKEIKTKKVAKPKDITEQTTQPPKEKQLPRNAYSQERNRDNEPRLYDIMHDYDDYEGLVQKRAMRNPMRTSIRAHPRRAVRRRNMAMRRQTRPTVRPTVENFSPYDYGSRERGRQQRMQPRSQTRTDGDQSMPRGYVPLRNKYKPPVKKRRLPIMRTHKVTDLSSKEKARKRNSFNIRRRNSRILARKMKVPSASSAEKYRQKLEALPFSRLSKTEMKRRSMYQKNRDQIINRLQTRNYNLDDDVSEDSTTPVMDEVTEDSASEAPVWETGHDWEEMTSEQEREQEALRKSINVRKGHQMQLKHGLEDYSDLPDPRYEKIKGLSIETDNLRMPKPTKEFVTDFRIQNVLYPGEEALMAENPYGEDERLDYKGTRKALEEAAKEERKRKEKLKEEQEKKEQEERLQEMWEDFQRTQPRDWLADEPYDEVPSTTPEILNEKNWKYNANNWKFKLKSVMLSTRAPYRTKAYQAQGPVRKPPLPTQPTSPPKKAQQASFEQLTLAPLYVTEAYQAQDSVTPGPIIDEAKTERPPFWNRGGYPQGSYMPQYQPPPPPGYGMYPYPPYGDFRYYPPPPPNGYVYPTAPVSSTNSSLNATNLKFDEKPFNLSKQESNSATNQPRGANNNSPQYGPPPNYGQEMYPNWGEPRSDVDSYPAYPYYDRNFMRPPRYRRYRSRYRYDRRPDIPPDDAQFPYPQPHYYKGYPQSNVNASELTTPKYSSR